VALIQPIWTGSSFIEGLSDFTPHIKCLNQMFWIHQKIHFLFRKLRKILPFTAYERDISLSEKGNPRGHPAFHGFDYYMSSLTPFLP